MTGRESFWNRIGDLIANGMSPTVLIGDLNGTLVDHECLHYTNHNNSARYSFDLRRMVARTGLIDLGCLGGKFTWFQKATNSNGGTAIRRARLDRALASTDWRILFPNAIVELLTVGTSDHKPILLSIDGGVRCIKAQFKYELMWGRDPRCFWVVRNVWWEKLHHNPMVNLYQKLKKTKEHLKRWNKTHFRRIQQRVAEAKNDLEKIESKDQVQMKTLGDARAKLNEALRREEVFWRQKSRVAWLRDGDHCIKFFMASTVIRRRKNYIQTLKTENGDWVSDQKLIAEWNAQMVKDWFSPADATAILNIDLPDEGIEDSWIWLDGITGTCLLCREACETSFHLFWKCNFAKAIWFNIGWGIRTELVAATNWKQWLDGFWKGPNLPPNVAFYDFRRERNRRVHGEKDMDIMQITNSIRQRINDHVMVSSKTVQEVIEWSPPPSDWVCCNSDVAVSAAGFMLSAVIRDDLGNIISISSRESRVTLQKLAEAQAVCLALEKAAELGLQRITFQSDNICVVKAFEAPMSVCTDFMLQEAKARFTKYCSTLCDWGIVHISRKCNYMAHNITKWAAAENFVGCINPVDVDGSVLDDLREWDPGSGRGTIGLRTDLG
ncbi:hypothetical protein F8388_020529 [Cannabis sativa]|uniref:RNase H type-1 domain-containing protein n=1 Tax=Cannabis sativa TaxID=3483 RepID=A0A7J6EX52_CANSA|nr:hypothetical protein F8388_020529 [Cannabis sativa]